MAAGVPAVSTDPSFEAYEIAAQFRNVIVSRFVDVVGTSKIPMLDLAGHYERISSLALERIYPELDKMGITLTQFFVENISLPPEVEAALDKRSQMSVLGNLDQYAKFQSAEAMRDAAQNPSGGGAAGIGVGLGAGAAMGQAMAGALSQAATPQQQTVPSGAPCALCGNPVPAGAKFCPSCGTPVSKTCANCGAANSGTAKFCSECGKPLA